MTPDESGLYLSFIKAKEGDDLDDDVWQRKKIERDSDLTALNRPLLNARTRSAQAFKAHNQPSHTSKTGLPKCSKLKFFIVIFFFFIPPVPKRGVNNSKVHIHRLLLKRRQSYCTHILIIAVDGQAKELEVFDDDDFSSSLLAYHNDCSVQVEPLLSGGHE